MQSTRLEDNVRERVELSVERLRGRATVGDVAASAGLRLAEAEEALKALAYDSQADIQVTLLTWCILARYWITGHG